MLYFPCFSQLHDRSQEALQFDTKKLEWRSMLPKRIYLGRFDLRLLKGQPEPKDRFSVRTYCHTHLKSKHYSLIFLKIEVNKFNGPQKHSWFFLKEKHSWFKVLLQIRTVLYKYFTTEYRHNRSCVLPAKILITQII